MKSADTKYLTQMKELPPEVEEESPPEKMRGTEVSVKPPEVIQEKKESVAESLIEEENLEEDVKTNRILTSKDIILGIVNLVSIVLLVLILIAFPKKAKELNDLETERLLGEANTSFRLEDIRVNLEKSQQIQNLFLDESGLVDFVGEVEKIRGEGGSVKNISFASQVAVKDRTGNFGIPVVIELAGSWEAIGADLQKIDNLPFLFRAANIQIEPSEEEERVVEFKYGIFIYVDEKLGQTR